MRHRSLRLTPILVMMPFQHAVAMWGALFGDQADAMTVPGAAVIAAAGLSLLRPAWTARAT